MVVFLIVLVSCNAPSDSGNTRVSIETTLGEIEVELYNDTPLHRDNFIKLVNTGVYDGVLFHRVINSFMIQTGDATTRSIPLQTGSDTINDYTISAEFRPGYFHKKGALAAAREGNEVNPYMRSSGTQFYIVQGIVYSDDDLIQAEQNINTNLKMAIFNKLLREVSDSAVIVGDTLTPGQVQERATDKMFRYLAINEDYKIPEEQKQVYKTIGGVPRLDQTYTVFGEVTKGLEIVDKIAAVPTDPADKPVSDIRIIKVKISSK